MKIRLLVISFNPDYRLTKAYFDWLVEWLSG